LKLTYFAFVVFAFTLAAQDLPGSKDPPGTKRYSRRRAATVVRELTSKFGIAADRLDAFGCGPYAPVESNETEQGRAKNRRVELVRW
jgi:flagellar motor protein MotB